MHWKNFLVNKGDNRAGVRCMPTVLREKNKSSDSYEIDYIWFVHLLMCNGSYVDIKYSIISCVYGVQLSHALLHLWFWSLKDRKDFPTLWWTLGYIDPWICPIVNFYSILVFSFQFSIKNGSQFFTHFFEQGFLFPYGFLKKWIRTQM